ncbi:hypothetical protein MANES_05G025100v8 [Manihot esculenta]|uniref:Uncharacterized protein n=2 Tax=Manihot esculenta TaxID=3983 RepID=A0A2C9VSQ8_MANES|nr:hypothetical protein MANES_05G025100v8 [Manihot esculenta]
MGTVARGASPIHIGNNFVIAGCSDLFFWLGEEAYRQQREKMIHRKWSLLTGPVAILGGIVATVVVANLIFVKDDPFLKPKKKNQDSPPSTK